MGRHSGRAEPRRRNERTPLDYRRWTAGQLCAQRCGRRGQNCVGRHEIRPGAYRRQGGANLHEGRWVVERLDWTAAAAEVEAKRRELALGGYLGRSVPTDSTSISLPSPALRGE